MNPKILAILITIAIFLLGSAFTTSYNATVKADTAAEKVSALSAQITGMEANISGIRENTDRIMDYFKLTPKDK